MNVLNDDYFELCKLLFKLEAVEKEYEEKRKAIKHKINELIRKEKRDNLLR